jgi:3-dehydroquinate synthetase
MRQDKKAQGGKLTFILAHGIGNTFVARNIPDQDVIEFLQEDIKRK